MNLPTPRVVDSEIHWVVWFVGWEFRGRSFGVENIRLCSRTTSTLLCLMRQRCCVKTAFWRRYSQLPSNRFSSDRLETTSYGRSHCEWFRKVEGHGNINSGGWGPWRTVTIRDPIHNHSQLREGVEFHYILPHVLNEQVSKWSILYCSILRATDRKR